VLPVTENINLPPQFGMRHKAAVGISEITDAIVVLVSEETGKISFVAHGDIKYGVTSQELKTLLENDLSNITK
jgi:DNA integrity scanning protein DisA with diadenylate cyclase activity